MRITYSVENERFFVWDGQKFVVIQPGYTFSLIPVNLSIQFVKFGVSWNDVTKDLNLILLDNILSLSLTFSTFFVVNFNQLTTRTRFLCFTTYHKNGEFQTYKTHTFVSAVFQDNFPGIDRYCRLFVPWTSRLDPLLESKKRK